MITNTPPSSLTPFMSPSGHANYNDNSATRQPQASNADIAQLSWKGFKSAIAAGGPPTTTIGWLFDKILGITEYPESPRVTKNSDTNPLSEKSANLRFLRAVYGEVGAISYEEVVFEILAIYNSSEPEGARTAQCIVDNLDKISSVCQENLDPGKSGIELCTPDHPAYIVPTECSEEQPDDIHSAYFIPLTTTTPSSPQLYLYNTIRRASSNTSLPSGTYPSMILLNNIWEMSRTWITDSCYEQLMTSFQKHLWCNLHPCFPDNKESFADCGQQVTYSKAPHFPYEAQKPYILNLNPHPNGMNLYYNVIREYPDVTELYAFEWQIIVSGQAFKPEAIPVRDCIIQTLANTTTTCYQRWAGEVNGNTIWDTNCSAAENILFSPIHTSLNLGMIVEMNFGAMYTDLFGGVYAHHNIAYASTQDSDNPFPPFVWPQAITCNTLHYDSEFSNAFPGRHLCAIQHCFPPSEEMTERFSECKATTVNPPANPQGFHANRYHIVAATLGLLSVALFAKLVVGSRKHSNRGELPKEVEQP